MQDSRVSALAPKHIDVLLFDRFSNHCLANTIEPLRAANLLSQQSLYAWRILSLDGAPVVSSSGLTIAPQGPISSGDGDTLIVMPSYGVRELDTPDVVRTLRAHLARYPYLAGFDTGSWLLARAGVLNGYKATLHWDELDSFSETFSDVDTVQRRFVIDRNRITCSGAMAAFDLIVHLIGHAHGPLLAMEVANLFMVRDKRPPAAHVPATTDRTITSAIAIMQANLERPLPIPQIAAQLGCTQKTLEHRMRRAMHTTPQAVYLRLRLNQALRLVSETDQTIAEIAARSGYDNASAMTRAFRSAFAATPSGIRGERADRAR